MVYKVCYLGDSSCTNAYDLLALCLNLSTIEEEHSCACGVDNLYLPNVKFLVG